MYGEMAKIDIIRISSYGEGFIYNDLAKDYELAYNSLISEFPEIEEDLSFLAIEEYKNDVLTINLYIALFLTIHLLTALSRMSNLFKDFANSKRDIEWEDVSNVYFNGFTLFGRMVKNLVSIRYLILGKLLTSISTGRFDEKTFELTNGVFYWWKLIVSDFATIFDRYSRLNEMFKDGVGSYQFISEEDEKVCEDCGGLHGETFPVDKAIVGLNFPPIHNYCRCWIVKA